METSYRQASQGQLPDKLPSEIYCHTLTDDSILSPDLRAKGFHTLTLFGLDTPWRLFAGNNEAMRQAHKRRSSQVSMPGWRSRSRIVSRWRAMGVPASKARARSISRTRLVSITATSFRTRSRFPLRKQRAGGQWGVETEYEDVYLCGSSAQRGGAVSGIPGHNAAMKVLERIAEQRT